MTDKTVVALQLEFLNLKLSEKEITVHLIDGSEFGGIVESCNDAFFTLSRYRVSIKSRILYSSVIAYSIQQKEGDTFK